MPQSRPAGSGGVDELGGGVVVGLPGIELPGIVGPDVEGPGVEAGGVQLDEPRVCRASRSAVGIFFMPGS